MLPFTLPGAASSAQQQSWTRLSERGDFRKTPKNYSENFGLVLVCKHLRVYKQLVFVIAWMSRGYLLHIHASPPRLCATRHCKQRLLSASARWQPNEHIGIMLGVMNRWNYLFHQIFIEVIFLSSSHWKDCTVGNWRANLGGFSDSLLGESIANPGL